MGLDHRNLFSRFKERSPQVYCFCKATPVVGPVFQPLCKRIGDPEADIMPRECVAAAPVAEAEKKNVCVSRRRTSAEQTLEKLK
jgi:hypothetical protein